MKKLILPAVLLIVCGGYSQCPFTVSLQHAGSCPGSQLTVVTTDSLARIVWLQDAVVLETVSILDPSKPFTRSFYAATPGTYRASVSDTAGCTVTTNDVLIFPPVHTVIQISASATDVCQDSLITFTAIPPNNRLIPVYHWQVNGKEAGANNPVYTNGRLSDNDIVSCLMTTTSTDCISASSNSIPITIRPSPHVDSSQVVTYRSGQNIVLDAHVTGPVATYTWSPSSGLSDPAIEHPLASPVQDITYTLTVVSDNGCSASGAIALKLYAPISIPNAFTPNGDGRNDIFYVKSGSEIRQIRDFAVFNRWGQKIFQVHDVPAGAPAFGWNGSYKGSPVTPGVYVYAITVQLTNGSRKVLQGTVVLIR